MTKVTISDTTQSVTVQEAVYQVQIASAAADTQVNSGGSGTSLIKSSTGGVTTLKSVAGGSNVTLTDDGNGTITISAVEDDLSNNTTDNLSEGSSNQYFTDARVMTALETVSGHVIPSANVTYDLGSTTHMWRDVYVGPGSLFVNGKKVLSADTGEINVTTDDDENLNISAGGSGSSGDVTIFSAGSTTQLNDNTINLGPALNTATVNVRGTLDVVNKIEMGDLDLTSGQIHQDSTDGDLTIKTNGTGKVIANTSNLVVGTLDGNNQQITPTGITGTLTGTVSSISNHDTDALSEGSTNLYFTNARADARAQLKVDALVDSAPGALDTLNELAAALGDDANFSTTVTNSIATKLATADFNSTFDTRLATKDTDNISEGSSNLYYTDARFNTAFGNKSTSDLSEGTNLYYTDSRFDTRLGTKNTDNLSEGSSNQYFTNARADARVDAGFSSKNTDNLSEGSSNQYFTTARARASISASGSLAYNSSTGALTYTQGNTDTVSEGSSNLYFTNARADARVNNAILDEDDFSSDSATKVPSQQSVKAYIATQIATKDNTDEITEGSSNLYFTDARARAAISENSTQLSYNNSTGVLTYTQGDTDTVSEGSSNLYHTSARAIAAVEGESTLDLTGALTVDGQISTDNVLKVDDGFVQTAFNPYGAGTNMPTRVSGIGADDGGWAAMHIRSRGLHDFGIGSQFNLTPRALVTLSAGRESSGSDDYLDNGDTFGAVLWNPYAGYRTGTEWLTPSASIYGIATEDHSASGMGTKLEFATTENTNKAGSSDLAHTNKSIFLQGTTITTSDTLKIDDDLQVTGNIGNNGSAVDFDDNIKITGNVSTKTTTIGDFDSSGSPAYAFSGIQLDAGDTAWPTVVFKEYAGTDGGGNKPVNLFTNPGFETEVFGGTPASPAALGASKRILSVNGNAANGATLPGTANLRILGKTVNVQSGSNRGSEFVVETTPVDTTSTIESLKVIANKVIIGQSDFDSGHGRIQANGGDLKLEDRLDTNGNNILNSSGDVTVDDNLKVNTNLTVDGNTVLGNNTSVDTVTVNAKITANAGLVLTSMDTATANYLAGQGAIDEGSIIYCTDGDSGSKALAVYDGSAWKRVSLGANISSS